MGDFHARIVESVTCDGSIIIIHVPDRPLQVQTLDIIRMAIPALRDRGMDVVRLKELFDGQHATDGLIGCGSSIILSLCINLFLLFLVVAICLCCSNCFRYGWALKANRCRTCCRSLSFLSFLRNPSRDTLGGGQPPIAFAV